MDNVYGVLIDTDISDLAYLKYRYRIPAGEGIVSGEGTLKNLDLGMEVMHAEKYSIIDKISSLKGVADCFFLISSLGGGTGGASGILLEELKKNFIEPVYYIGLLPSKEDLPTITLNAARSLKEAFTRCDAFFPIDMDRLKTSTRLIGNFHSLNNQIFRYFQALFEVGEFKGRADIGENTVDFSDIEKTMKGLSSAGLRAQNLEEEPRSDKPEAVISLTQKATRAMTLPVAKADVQKALVVVLGDRKHINFLGSIPARLWVEKNIGGKEVRGGDYPLHKKGQVEVLVIYSDIKRSEEINSLYQRVEVLGNNRDMVENLSEIVGKLGSMKAKLADLEKEVDEAYQSLKESLKG
jgi:cell division GTPase FtsZ